jgi:hypothetical protein
MRLLRKRQAAIAQHVRTEKCLSVDSNGLYGAVAFDRIAIAQEAGHRRCDQLEPHVVEDRWERNALRDRADVHVLKALFDHKGTDLVRHRKDMLGAFDPRRIRSQAMIQSPCKCTCSRCALDGAADTERNCLAARRARSVIRDRWLRAANDCRLNSVRDDPP